MMDYGPTSELRWHRRALAHAEARREELLGKYGRSLPHRALLQEFVGRMDDDLRWHRGRIGELEAAAD